MMKRMGNWTLFLLSILIGFVVVVGMAGYDYWKRNPTLPVTSLARGVDVAPQLQLDEIEKLKRGGYATIIDLRPDGEEPDQPGSDAVGKAAVANRMAFFYIPVPHGDKVPDEVVARLSEAMSASKGPVLLYCRSGRRATRAWSLAEASRQGGLEASDIRQTAEAAGHSVADLEAAIAGRILQRKALKGEKS